MRGYNKNSSSRMRAGSPRSSHWLLAWCGLGLFLWWSQAAHGAEGSLPAFSSGWLDETLRQRGLLLGLLAVFLGGLALNLTPCVYPLLPVTLAFFSGQATGRKSRVLRLALTYVLGLSISYALLGVIAARTGALLGSWLQKPIVLIVVAAVIAALALSMFGLYELRPPQALTRRFGQASTGFSGAFVMGLVVGLIAAPCVGPFLLGLLLFVSQLANPGIGFLLFLTLGFGMGLPYVILALTIHRVNQLPKAGVWLVWSKQALGFVLLGLAFYVLKPLLPPWGVGIAFAGVLLGAGTYVGWLARSTDARPPAVWLRRALGSILVVASVLVAWPRTQASAPIAWVPYSEAALEQAQREQRPILIDIYADWCLPCVEMDHVTFRHPDVVRALSSVATLRLNVTDEVSEEGQQLIARYRIYGAPTILVFDRTGKERSTLRVLGFVTPEEFLEIVEQVL